MTDIIDMARFVEAKSDQLNADDLIGADRTITITRVVGCDGDQPIAIHYQGDNGKPFKPCKTVRRILLAIWGRNAADYVGRSMTLYRDDSVQFGGLQVGGIRVRAMSHLDKETVVVVMKTKGKKAGIKVQPLKVDASKASGGEMEAWAAKFIARAAEAENADQLNSYVAGQMKWLDKLSDDLRAKCDDAVSDRLCDLMPTEGRDTPDMGEGFSGADFGE